MKKQLIVIVVVFALLLTMTGFLLGDVIRKLDRMEDRIEANLDIAEDTLEARLWNMGRPAPDTVPAHPAPKPESAPAPAEAPPAARENNQELTEEQALQVALDYLGFSSNQVTRLRTAYEFDDRIPQYDVEFSQGDWEYEFEIHAEDGRIISYDKDHKYD